MVKLGFFVLLLVSFWSCKDITDQYLYKRPSWLEGKLYKQMSSRDDLSLFVEGVARTAYKDVLDRSGYFTVFAPTNDAMKAYMSEKGYASVQDIPVNVMEGIVRFHTLQNGWNIEQLKFYRSGWIEEEDIENYSSLFYKRSTIFEDSAQFIRYGNTQYTGGVKKDYKIIPTGRKVVPLYYREAMELENRTMDDYASYVGRTDIGADDICYGAAKVLEREIPAENGFVYTVDRVMEPMKTVRQYLENSDKGESYSKFLSLLDEFRYLTADYDATNEQEGADLGRDIDTLYTTSYRLYGNDFGVNPDQEITFAGTATSFDLGGHPSVFIPNDAAFNQLMAMTLTSDEFPHYFNMKSVPLFVKAFLLISFMSESEALDSDLERGIMTLEKTDSINYEVMPEESIAEKAICSNGYFIGLNKSYVPSFLSSVVGPIIMRPGYSYLMYGVRQASLFPALMAKGANYSFFAVPDAACDRDSSFVITVPDPDEPLLYSFWNWNFLTGMEEPISRSIVKKMIKNHIAMGTFTSYDNGGASVQFLPTLGGNFVKYYERNDTAFAQGTARSSERADFFYTDPLTGEDSTWRDAKQTEIIVDKLPEPTDNGSTYATSNWFKLNTTGLYDRLKGYNKFIQLMYKSGLASETYARHYLELSSGEQCTGFIPSDAALETFQADTITNRAVLRTLLLSHFVRGVMIFTDGNVQSGDYQTLLSSVSLSVETGIDMLKLLNDKTDEFDDYDVIKDNSEYNEDRYLVNGSDNAVRDNLLNEKLNLNVLSANVNSSATSNYDRTTQAVTHKIETVIVPEVLKAYFNK